MATGSDIRVSTAIMAHPKRKEFIPSLKASLNVDTPVVWDSGNNNRWDTGRRSMLAFDPKATHHMVIQDDAIVCPDLVAGVTKALKHIPRDVVLGLYVGRSRPIRETMERVVVEFTPRTRWIVMDNLHWGVGVVFPTVLIPDMIAWCDKRPEIPNYDKRMGRWCQHRGVEVWYPWPNLVDHRDSPSLVRGRRAKGRYSYRFIGSDVSALSIPWGEGEKYVIGPINRRYRDRKDDKNGEERWRVPTASRTKRRTPIIRRS